MPNGNFIVNVPLDPSGAATMPIVRFVAKVGGAVRS